MTVVFPTTDPRPDYPFIISPRFKTIVSETEDGVEIARRKRLFPVYDVTFRYTYIDSALEFQTLYDFYMERGGRFERFFVYDPRVELGNILVSHKSQYIGVGDGVQTIFDIPGKSTSGQSIYINGILQTIITDYTILIGGGDGDSDRVEFVSAPPAGDVITCDFTGILRMYVRFANDFTNFEWFIWIIQRTGLQMRGVQMR